MALNLKSGKIRRRDVRRLRAKVQKARNFIFRTNELRSWNSDQTHNVLFELNEIKRELDVMDVILKENHFLPLASFFKPKG